jgi:hypothetical protein
MIIVGIIFTQGDGAEFRGRSVLYRKPPRNVA